MRDRDVVGLPRRVVLRRVERERAGALRRRRVAFRAGQFAGRDEVPLTVMIGTGMEPTLPSGQWLTVFATWNGATDVADLPSQILFGS